MFDSESRNSIAQFSITSDRHGCQQTLRCLWNASLPAADAVTWGRVKRRHEGESKCHLMYDLQLPYCGAGTAKRYLILQQGRFWNSIFCPLVCLPSPRQGTRLSTWHMAKMVAHRPAAQDAMLQIIPRRRVFWASHRESNLPASLI